MAIKKESEALSAGGKALPNKKASDLIRARHDLKDKKAQKNYEGGIDPQDEQLNTLPEGTGSQQGSSKPGGGNRIHRDPAGSDKDRD